MVATSAVTATTASMEVIEAFNGVVDEERVDGVAEEDT